MSIDDYIPEDEGHHSDGSGKGPADTWILRPGHQWIHQDVADACRSLGEKTRGFAGDPTTLKLGNSLLDSEEFRLGIIFPEKKKKNPYSFLNMQDSEEKPDYSGIAKYFKEKQKKENPYDINSILGTKSPPAFGYKPLPIIDTENQNHWLGFDKPQDTTLKPWSISDSIKPPVLDPVDTTNDPYNVAYLMGKKVVDDILERKRQEKISFERNNLGEADFKNALYKTNMFDKSSIPTLGSMPPPPGFIPFRL